MTVTLSGQRARRHAITWRVRVRRPQEDGWNTARAVNLSVSGILLKATQLYLVGEHLELEIDCRVRPEINTILRAAGEVVRIDRHRRGPGRLAIHFNTDGATIFSDASPLEGLPDARSTG